MGRGHPNAWAYNDFCVEQEFESLPLRDLSIRPKYQSRESATRCITAGGQDIACGVPQMTRGPPPPFCRVHKKGLVHFQMAGCCELVPDLLPPGLSGGRFEEKLRVEDSPNWAYGYRGASRSRATNVLTGPPRSYPGSPPRLPCGTGARARDPRPHRQGAGRRSRAGWAGVFRGIKRG